MPPNHRTTRRTPVRAPTPLRGPIRRAISGYRYYNPELGRWINRDPIEESEGLNPYAFIENDPQNWIDLLGLSKIPPNSNILVTGIPKTVEAYQAALDVAIRSGASPQHIRQLRAGLKVLKRNIAQRGFVSTRLLARVNAVGVGLLVGNVAVSIADAFSLWSDKEPDWTVTESGDSDCAPSMVRVAVEQVAVVRFAHAHISGLLWGLGGSADPVYWYEKSLAVTYACCCREPSESEWKVDTREVSTPVSHHWLWGALASGKGTAFYKKETVTGPCHK